MDSKTNRKTRPKVNIDDGFNPELLDGAEFDGILEFPHIFPPDDIIPLGGITPLTQRERMPTEFEAVGFFEKDPEFFDVMLHPEAYIEEFARFPVLIPPDCSAYRDATLTAQIANLYRSRVYGSYFQRNGSNVYPLVRWGDERTYTTCVLPEKAAFVGIEMHTPVVVSNYGCFQNGEDKYHFRAGLVAMVSELEPSLVIVYGSMNDRVFEELEDRTKFVAFPNWTKRMRGGE